MYFTMAFLPVLRSLWARTLHHMLQMLLQNFWLLDTEVLGLLIIGVDI